MTAAMELVMDKTAHSVAEDPGARILIVDDDPGIRDVIADFLIRHGYRVDQASDARSMELALQRNPADLIVLDVMMPGEDGLSICRRLSGQGGGPGIVLLSAMGEEPARIVGLVLGDHACRPVSVEPVRPVRSDRERVGVVFRLVRRAVLSG